MAAKPTPAFTEQSTMVPTTLHDSCCVIVSRKLRLRNVESCIPDHTNCSIPSPLSFLETVPSHVGSGELVPSHGSCQNVY